jgi:hypothetical protein
VLGTKPFSEKIEKPEGIAKPKKRSSFSTSRNTYSIIRELNGRCIFQYYKRRRGVAEAKT